MSAAVPSLDQYLSFRLDAELFAIDVLRVREVMDLGPITKVPHSPDYLLGVVNVRGNAIPVIDLRTRFGLPRAAPSVNTRIIVLDLAAEGAAVSVGAVADVVHEVLELDSSQIEPPPRIGLRWRTDFLRGIARRDDEFLVVLNIDKIFSTEEAALVEKVPAEDPSHGEASSGL